jgi:hypothetical protein
MATLNPKHHAKKSPRDPVKRTIAEKRKRPTQSESSAVRAQRGGKARPHRD